MLTELDTVRDTPTPNFRHLGWRVVLGEVQRRKIRIKIDCISRIMGPMADFPVSCVFPEESDLDATFCHTCANAHPSKRPFFYNN